MYVFTTHKVGINVNYLGLHMSIFLYLLLHVTYNIHGGKYLKAEIVRQKGIAIYMYLQFIKYE